VVDDPVAVRARQDRVLTAHYMDEAQHLANRVAVMRSGEIIAQGRPED
jgi:ABC-type multidrug transport system ATPase subunit